MSLLSTGTELKRFRVGTLPKIALVVMLFIPLIYGALYLWAFWAPDKHMDQLDIALVNQDQSVTLSDGTQLDAGADVVDALLDDGQLGWVVTDAADASAGVDDGTYAFAVTIPEDFSDSLASLEDGDAQAGQIVVTYNDTNGFLATTLGQHAMTTVKDTVADLVSETDATKLLEGVAELSQGITEAADASVQLDGGAGELASGLGDLSAGLAELASGTHDAAVGAGDLADGLGDIEAGATALSDGLSNLDAAVTTMPRDAAALSTGAARVSASLATISQLATAHPDWTLAQLNAALAAQGGSLSTLAQGAAQVASGAGSLSAAAPTLASAVTQLDSGAAELAQGVAQAQDGASTLDGGLSQLDSGASGAASGAQSAYEGSTELFAGTQEFAATLGEAATAAPTYTQAQITAMAKVVAQPVVLDETTENEVQGFGEGFAPFFIALATFVGSLITWLILRPLPRRPLATAASGLRAVFTGYMPAVAIASGQVAIMMAVLVFGLGLEPKYLAATTAFVALTTLAFLALQQMFIITLGGAAGKVVSLVLLMLQLSSSGGTYPVETTPGFFAAIHPFMPATYVVDGLRALMGGGIDSRFWLALTFMVGLLVVSLAVSAFAASRQKVWTISRLHPELAI